jgi:hypothetical protein
MSKREIEEKFDWSKTWVAEMFLSESERKRREQLIEEQRGITPEVKRHNEIKAGVITSSIGVGLMIFLYVFMQGIVLGGKITPSAAEIISRVWVAGVIPFFVGVGLLINGIVVSKKLIETTSKQQLPKTENQKSFEKNTENLYLNSADESEYIPSGFSVTEETTRKLTESERKRQ